MGIFPRRVTCVTTLSVGLARLASPRLSHPWTVEIAEGDFGTHAVVGGPSQGGGESEELLLEKELFGDDESVKIRFEAINFCGS